MVPASPTAQTSLPALPQTPFSVAETPDSSISQPPAWRRWMVPSAPTTNVSFAPGTEPRGAVHTPSSSLPCGSGFSQHQPSPWQNGRGGGGSGVLASGLPRPGGWCGW